MKTDGLEKAKKEAFEKEKARINGIIEEARKTNSEGSIQTQAKILGIIPVDYTPGATLNEEQKIGAKILGIIDDPQIDVETDKIKKIQDFIDKASRNFREYALLFHTDKHKGLELEAAKDITQVLGNAKESLTKMARNWILEKTTFLFPTNWDDPLNKEVTIDGKKYSDPVEYLKEELFLNGASEIELNRKQDHNNKDIYVLDVSYKEGQNLREVLRLCFIKATTKVNAVLSPSLTYRPLGSPQSKQSAKIELKVYYQYAENAYHLYISKDDINDKIPDIQALGEILKKDKDTREYGEPFKIVEVSDGKDYKVSASQHADLIICSRLEAALPEHKIKFVQGLPPQLDSSSSQRHSLS